MLFKFCGGSPKKLIGKAVKFSKNTEKTEPLFSWTIYDRFGLRPETRDYILLINDKNFFTVVFSREKLKNEENIEDFLKETIQNAMAAEGINEEEINTYFQKGSEFVYTKGRPIESEDLEYMLKKAERLCVQENAFDVIAPDFNEVIENSLNHSIVNYDGLKAYVPLDAMKKELAKLCGKAVEKGQEAYEISITTHKYPNMGARFSEVRTFLIPADYTFEDLGKIIDDLIGMDYSTTVGFEMFTIDTILRRDGFPATPNVNGSLYILKRSGRRRGKDLGFNTQLKEVLPEWPYAFFLYRNPQEMIQDISLGGIIENYTGELPYLSEMTQIETKQGKKVAALMKGDPDFQRFERMLKKFWTQEFTHPRPLKPGQKRF